ncbi:hypothetical protein [Yersinia intermedia]|uniref:hypothetical protein n=1 Tax=Yersinia intermedia TaxID=631 RepID=UPI0025AA3D91|nr:hypothetical protein [Yersinia intermedia]MDN0113195.1 hypothetical protein [Yersinia intermedia]
MEAITLLVARAVLLGTVGIDISQLKANGTNPASAPTHVETLSADVLHAYAKIEQELTIARRTLISDTVEIEEYYGNEIKGGANAKLSATELNVGVNGEGSKVTKRVIRFTGFNEHAESILNTLEASLLAKLKTELSASSVISTSLGIDSKKND